MLAEVLDRKIIDGRLWALCRIHAGGHREGLAIRVYRHDGTDVSRSVRTVITGIKNIRHELGVMFSRILPAGTCAALALRGLGPEAVRYRDRLSTEHLAPFGTLQPALTPARAVWNCPAGITALAFAPDGSTLTATAGDGTVRTWRCADGVLLHEVRGSMHGHPHPLRPPEDDIPALPDLSEFYGQWGNNLFDGRGAVRQPQVALMAVDAERTRGAASDGRNGLRFWDLQKRTLLFETNATERVTVLAVASGAPYAAAGLRDGSVVVCDLAQRRQAATWRVVSRGVSALAFAPGGMLLATGNREGRVEVRRVDGTPAYATEPALAEGVQALAYAENGRRLYASDGTMLQMWDAQSGALLGTFPRGGGYTMACARHVPLLAVARLTTVYFYDALTGAAAGQAVTRQHKHGINALSFSRSGDLAVSGNGMLGVYDTVGQRWRWQRQMDISAPPVWARCDAILLVGCGDGSVRIAEAKDGTVKERLSGLPEAPTVVQISYDDRCLAVGDGCALRLWVDDAVHPRYGTLATLFPVAACAFGSSDLELRAVDRCGNLYRWRRADGVPCGAVQTRPHLAHPQVLLMRDRCVIGAADGSVAVYDLSADKF